MREEIFEAYAGHCMCPNNCGLPATDIHHVKHNTDTNKKLFPLFLESPFNKLPLNNGCHLSKPLPKQPTDIVCRVYEDYLQKLKKG